MSTHHVASTVYGNLKEMLALALQLRRPEAEVAEIRRQLAAYEKRAAGRAL